MQEKKYRLVHRHNYWYSQGAFRCKKCGHVTYKSQKGPKYRPVRSYKLPIIASVIIASIIMGYFIYQAYGTPQAIQNEANKIISNTGNTIQKISSQVRSQVPLASLQDNRLTTVPNTILTEDNYYAQLVPSNFQIIDKGRYNVVSFNVTVNVENMPFDANVHFEDLYTTLEDQNSKIYQPDPQECTMNGFIPIIGKQTTNANYNVCYSVDKTSNNFSIFYTEPSINYHEGKAGYLIFDSDFFTYYQSHYNPQPIQIGRIALTNNP